jgi:hypothetical protein
MNQRTLWWIVGIVVVIIIILVLSSNYGGPTTTTTTNTNTNSGTTYDQTISDGTLAFGYPSKDFGLATNQTQILVHPNTPPCDATFNYCLFYNGTAYQGTNFESAGIRIAKRTDLTLERLCIETPPQGYDSSMTPNATSSADTYASSVFTVGDAGAGHYANGSLYRLFVREDATCYEIETRIAATQFANYSPGTINEFTADMQAALKNEINAIVSSISFNGKHNLFPAQ